MTAGTQSVARGAVRAVTAPAASAYHCVARRPLPRVEPAVGATVTRTRNQEDPHG
jgi:hypothetical protein